MQTTSTRRRRSVLIPILVGLLLLAWAQSTHPIAPSEDAFITFRYAQNLADGHGLVWNPGEDPVEGSTEFLWAVLVAAVSKLGLGVEQAALTLNLLIGALAVIVLAWAAYALSRRNLPASLFAAAAFALGPLSYHVRAGFATALFTLLLTISFLAVVALAERRRFYDLAFPTLALSGLLLGLTRPEGVLYAGLALLSALILLPGPERRRLLRWTAALLLLPGLIYFIWRWQYFGYFLPNTFYVKSTGGLLHLRYFANIYELFRFMAPLFVLLGLGLAGMSRKAGFRRLVELAPALIFPWSYLLIDQLQNLGSRFQYPVYPIFLLAAAAALGALLQSDDENGSVSGLWRDLPLLVGAGFLLFGLFVVLEREVLLVALALAFIALKWIRQADRRSLALILAAAFLVLFAQHSLRLSQGFYPTQFDDRRSIGEALRPYAGRGYTIVATEAGWLPFFSGWRAIDPFGLNDEHVVHQGLSLDYLAAVQPDVIMYHDVPNPYPARWADMTALLKSYAEGNGFSLVAVIERKGPQDLHIYYVRDANPDAAALIEAITTRPGVIYQTP